MSDEDKSSLKRKFDSKRLGHLVDLHRNTEQHKYTRPSSFIQNDSSLSLTKQAAALTFQQFEDENDDKKNQSLTFSELSMALPLTEKMKELRKKFQDVSDLQIQSKYVSALNRMSSSSSIASETTSDSLVALANLAQRHFVNTSIHKDLRDKATPSQPNNSINFLGNNTSSMNNLQEKRLSESIPNASKNRIRSRWSLFFWNYDNTSQSRALFHNSETEDISEISTNDTSDASSIPSYHGELSGSIPSQKVTDMKTHQFASTELSISSTKLQPPLSLLSSSKSVNKHLHLLSYLSRLGDSFNDDNVHELTYNNITEKTHTSEAHSSTAKLSIKLIDGPKQTNKLRLMKHLFLFVIFGISVTIILEKRGWKFHRWYYQNRYIVNLEETVARWKLFLVSTWWYEKGLKCRDDFTTVLIPLQEWLYLLMHRLILYLNDFIQGILISTLQNYFDTLINLWEKTDILQKCENIIFDEEYFHQLYDTTMVVSIVSRNSHLDDFWDMIGKLCVNHNYTPQHNVIPIVDTTSSSSSSQLSNNRYFWQSTRKTFVKTSELPSLTNEQNEFHTKDDRTFDFLVEFDDQHITMNSSLHSQSLDPVISIIKNENNPKQVDKHFLMEQSDDGDLMHEKPLAEIVGDFFRRVRDGRRKKRRHRKNKKTEKKQHEKGHKLLRFSFPWKKK